MVFVKKTVTIRQDQDVWIKKHPEINLSGQIQHWLDNLIDAYEQH